MEQVLSKCPVLSQGLQIEIISSANSEHLENTREECCRQLATFVMGMGIGGGSGSVGHTFLPFP